MILRGYAGHRLSRALWGAASVASVVFALWIATDTLRSVLTLGSPLPWFDEWGIVDDFLSWRSGDAGLIEVLFRQFGEHRILVPRLLFFADDLMLGGQGRVGIVGTMLVQTLHAAMFVALLARSGPRPGRWLVGGMVVALMFTLRQAENFTTPFQIQFVGVFAAATLSFTLLGRAVSRAQRGKAPATAVAGSLLAALVATFSMANGLAAAFIVAALAGIARLGARTVAAIAGLALVFAALYAWGFEATADQTQLATAVQRPLDVLLYVAAYLGNIVPSPQLPWAIVLGIAGLALTGLATLHLLRQRPMPPSGIALVGVMMFGLASALVTASGRLDYGTVQATSSRYVTGSMGFWAAQLCFWWSALPASPPAQGGWDWRGAAPRLAVLALAVALAIPMVDAQRIAKPTIYAQKFAQDDAADLLLLGLDDPAVLRRIAWTPEHVRKLRPGMARERISIFAGAEADLVGHPLAGRTAIVGDAACAGDIEAARADATLGAGGVRVSGEGSTTDRKRRFRSVVLSDASGRVVGLAAGGDPGGTPHAWRGYAVAPVGAVLSAYGIEDGRACRLGSAMVTGAGPDAVLR